jgi:hypothetical protein
MKKLATAMLVLLGYSSGLLADSRILTLKGSSFMTWETKEEGVAKIPFQTMLLAGTPSDFEINLSYDENFKALKTEIAPKMPCRCADDAPDFTFKKQDEREHFKLEYVGDYRGRDITKLTYYPYSIAKESYASEIKVSRTDKNKAESFIFKNFESTKMLIVMPKTWEQEFDSYIRWREAQGVEIHKYTFDETTPDQLREVVRGHYENHQINYLWLIGDEDIITPYYIQTTNDVRTPSDLPFTLMGGDEDFIPDMFYGRLPISRLEEIRPFLKKVGNYERSTGKHVIGMASDEGYNPTDEEYLEQMVAPLRDELGFGNSIIHQSSRDGNKEALIRSLEAGASWINYIGHGIGHAWPSLYRSEFNTSDIAELAPAPLLPVVIDVACQNGRFSRDGRLGERFLNDSSLHNLRGAVAYYGGSVDVSWHPPAIMAVGINQELAALKNFNERLSLGELVLRGQLHLLENYDVTSLVRENFVWYHLLGDPLLNVRH